MTQLRTKDEAMPADEHPTARPEGPTADAVPDLPEHLDGWYAGDLDDAVAAHAAHTPSGLSAFRPPAPREVPAHEDSPAEGGRFLAAWYAGDLTAAAAARRAHDAAARLGRATG